MVFINKLVMQFEVQIFFKVIIICFFNYILFLFRVKIHLTSFVGFNLRGVLKLWFYLYCEIILDWLRLILGYIITCNTSKVKIFIVFMFLRDLYK